MSVTDRRMTALARAIAAGSAAHLSNAARPKGAALAGSGNDKAASKFRNGGHWLILGQFNRAGGGPFKAPGDAAQPAEKPASNGKTNQPDSHPGFRSSCPVSGRQGQ